MNEGAARGRNNGGAEAAPAAGVRGQGPDTIHVVERGDGEALVLVHGLGSSGDDWAFQMPAFVAHFRVLLPDLPGSGRSPPPPAYSIEGFATDLWAMLDRRRIERAHLVGFSLGGAIALEMALQRPERAGRLVMINALPSYRVDHWKKWFEMHSRFLMIRVLGLSRTARLIAHRMFPGPHQAAMRKRVSEVVGENPVDRYLATARALAGWCAQDRLHLLRSPTLIVAAEHDYTALSEKREIAARIGAQIAVILGSRHGTPFDSIRACNACVLAFLRGEPLPDPESLRADTPEETPSTAPPL
jgi:pimeloyl-ACP methyl ester carboxylesterase